MSEREIDFRKGSWGHAMHGGTWGEAPPRITGHLWWRKKVERVSVMVHCSPSPEIGDTVIYATKSNVERRAVIADIECCYDPRDMFTLTLEERP